MSSWENKNLSFYFASSQSTFFFNPKTNGLNLTVIWRHVSGPGLLMSSLVKLLICFQLCRPKYLHWDLSCCFIISELDVFALRPGSLCAVSPADLGSSHVPEVLGVTRTLPGKLSHITHFPRNEKHMCSQDKAPLTIPLHCTVSQTQPGFTDVTNVILSIRRLAVERLSKLLLPEKCHHAIV